MSDANTVEPAVLQPQRSYTLTSGYGFPVILALALIAGAAIFALTTASSGTPIVLTLLGLLASLGVFFLFGVIAGHIRIAERTTTTDLLRNAFDRVDHGVLVTGPDGAIRRANDAAADLLGVRSPDQLRLLEDAFGMDAQANASIFRLCRAVERGLSRSEDIFLPPQSGLRAGRWLRVSAKALGGNGLDADLTGSTLWTVLDVTRDRARIDKIRGPLESRLQKQENIPAGLLVFGTDDRIEHLNATACEWLGFDASGPGRELVLSDIISPDGITLLERARAATGSEPKFVDIDLIDAEETIWPATVVVAPRRTGLRAETGDDSSATNVQPEPALILPRRSTASLAASAPSSAASASIVSSCTKLAPFGIATITGSGRIAEANAAFSRLAVNKADPTGLDAVDVLCDRVSDEARATVQASLTAAIAGKANIAPVDITVGQDGALARRVFFLNTGRSDNNGQAAVIYVLDATEQRTLELKFAQSQKMEVVGKLAGGIAHDFNNDLTAIIGFSDLLLGTHRPGDAAYPNIKNIKSSAMHAAELVRNLLAFSRQQQLQPKVLDVHDIITDQTLLLKQHLNENIEFKTRSQRDLWDVKADAGELRRVIVNLVGNAADAMPDGGELTIRTRNVTERESNRLNEAGLPTGEYVLIEVADTGCGMTPDVLEKIFEPFFTTKDVGKGTGFGLSTVYGIVKQTNGYIFPESRPGKGTTFRVFLPRFVHEDREGQSSPGLHGQRSGGDTSEASRETPAQVAKPPHVDLTGVGRVLIVEDEDAVRLFAVQALKRQGYEVFQASDGYEALDLFEDEGLEVDLVVSDVKMPEMDGPTLLKTIRKSQPELKFVFVSGYPADAFSKTLADEDHYTFLPKPYSLAQIAETVKQQLGQ